MYRVKVVPDYDDINGLYWNDDQWKTWVCEDFDENVVVLDRNSSVEEASWWEDVCDIVDALENTLEEDLEDSISYFYDNYGADVSRSKYAACWKMSQWVSDIESAEFMVEVAEILNPKLSFSYGTIDGSSQGERAEVIYITDSIDLQLLEDMYYHNLYNVEVYRVDQDFDEDGDIIGESEDFIGGTTITGTEYWRMTNSQLEALVREVCYEIPDDEEIEIED